jgi:WD40 repeat protein
VTDLPTRLGPYVLGPVIGMGGAAVVVSARDERLEADVAIKILRVEDPEIGVRFLREARLLRRVSHPAVVTVHDVGETPDGRPFLVMDLAECSLIDRLREAVPPVHPSTLRALAGTLADGLGALHRVGVIHRDVKPANLLVLRDGVPGTELAAGQLLGPDERIVIGDLGFAKDQWAVNAGTTLLGGTPGYRPPEQLEYGRTVDARADVYAATAVLWLLVTGRRPPSTETLPVDLLAVPEAWRAMFERGLAADPAGRFASMAEWAQAAFTALGDGGPPSTVYAGERSDVATATFPYKGLSAFQPEDAALFFGRGALVESLVPRLGARSTLVIGGPSGSGKSSLLRAGLIPRLEAGALPGSAGRRTCLFTPGDRPLAALCRRLAAVDVADVSADALLADPDGAPAAVRTPVLLAVDQLEELFTQCRDPAERDAFLRVLDALTRGDRPRARAVLAVRADFYAACAAHPWLAAAVNANQVLVGPMTRPELREAIEGPARRVGLHLQEGLADRMLADTGDDAGALPLLAHALAETWLRRDGNVLTVAGYEAAGGVAGAVERTADEVWEQLSDADRPRARRLLLRLVQPGDGTPDTKRVLPWGAVGDHERNRLLVARFAEARLVTLDEHGVELAHEALLRSWGLLTSWLAESRDELRAGRRIEDAAREWERQGRHHDLLYRGLPLVAALEWRARQDGDVGESAAAFLAAAEEAREAAERAERDRRERTARSRRRVLTTLVTLTVLALVTSAVAAFGLQRSRRDARAARAANAAASEQLARALSASAVNLTANNPFLASMLAAAAMTRSDPPPADARDALVRSRIALAGSRLVPFGDPMPAPDAFSVAIRPAGDLAATGRRDGTVSLWDLSTRERIADLTGPHGGVESVAFTADGRRLVAGSDDGSVWTWELGDHPAGTVQGRVIASPGSTVWAVTAAPTGSTVAAATQSGEALVLDASTGAAIGDPLRPGAGDLMTVAFADGGSTLLAGSGRGEVLAWSLRDRTMRFPPIAAHTSRIMDLTVHQSGDVPSFVTVSTDGTARLWAVATGQRLPGGPFDDAGAAVPLKVRGAAFSADGDTLTLGGPDGAVYSWSVSGHRLAADPVLAHRDHVHGLASSADGLRLLTLGDDQTLQLWTRAPRPDPVVHLSAMGTRATSMALAPDAGTLAVGLEDGTVRLLDPANGGERKRLDGHGGAVAALAFLGPDRLVTGDAAGALRTWSASTGARLAEKAGAAAGGVTAIGVAAAGTADPVFAAGADGSVRRFREDLTETGTRFEVGGAVTDLAVDSRAAFVVATGRTGEVLRWNAGDESTERIASVKDTTGAVALRDRAVIVARADELLSAWTLGASRGTTPAWERGGHTGGALDVAYAGTTVAAGAEDGKIRLWDAATGVPIGPPLAVGDTPIRAVAGADDGTVWVVDRAGVVSRVDALVLGAACAAAGASLDARQRERMSSLDACTLTRR